MLQRLEHTLFDIFSKERNTWRGDVTTPCPCCEVNRQVRCPFSGTCAFQKVAPRDISFNRTEESSRALTEAFEEVRHKFHALITPPVPAPVEEAAEEEEAIDMALPLMKYVEHHGLALRLRLCAHDHSPRQMERCEAMGQWHDLMTMIQPFVSPELRRYYERHLFANKRIEATRLPSLPLSVGDVVERFRCRFYWREGPHHLFGSLYTHFKNGDLRPPICNLYCLQCGVNTLIAVYESEINVY